MDTDTVSDVESEDSIDTTPALPDADEESLEVESQQAAVLPAHSHRALKIVLTLQPTSEGAYQAILAVGADGCDPVISYLESSPLAAVLERIPTVLADAEAHWETAPRNPAVAVRPTPDSPRKATGWQKAAPKETGSGNDPQPEAPAAPARAPASPALDPVPAAPRPAAPPAYGSQMSLFDRSSGGAP